SAKQRSFVPPTQLPPLRACAAPHGPQRLIVQPLPTVTHRPTAAQCPFQQPLRLWYPSPAFAGGNGRARHTARLSMDEPSVKAQAQCRRPANGRTTQQPPSGDPHGTSRGDQPV